MKRIVLHIVLKWELSKCLIPLEGIVLTFLFGMVIYGCQNKEQSANSSAEEANNGINVYLESRRVGIEAYNEQRYGYALQCFESVEKIAPANNDLKEWISKCRRNIPHFKFCPDNEHPHVIDLGLPSGTKWACCNVGASTPIQKGYYLAWGETFTIKDNGIQRNHNTSNIYAKAKQNGSILDKTDDVAHLVWGESWYIPRKDNFQELLDNTTYCWTKLDSVNGALFSSKINGKSIFIPAAGFKYGELYFDNIEGIVWTSSLSKTNTSCACEFYFRSNFKSLHNSDTRDKEISVRPVTNVQKSF